MVRCGWALRFVHGCLRDCVHGYVYICCVDVCVCVCIYAHCDCACYVRICVVSASYNCGACRHARIACRQVLTSKMYLEACLWLCVPVCTYARLSVCVCVCVCCMHAACTYQCCASVGLCGCVRICVSRAPSAAEKWCFMMSEHMVFLRKSYMRPCPC